MVIRCIISVMLGFSLFPSHLRAQMVFASPAQFGDRIGTGLFIEQNGQVAQLPTGFPEHNFPSVSRDNRFVVFSSPDGVTAPLQVPPSSDIYVFDRAVAQTRRIVDHTTLIFSPNEVDTFTPVSASLSPDSGLLAYGVILTRREGLANPRSTKELNIARSSDGLILSNPTFGRGPVSDAFQAEFVGLAWDPAGASFVTPLYVTVGTQSGSQVQLPAIVRFAQNPGNGVWSVAQVLSAPRYFDAQFPIAAEVHLFPAISPSGAGLAYFHLTWPDALGSSRGVTARLVVANADGSDARFVTTFNEGFYPVGLAWSPDGNSLVISIAQQAVSGSGFLPVADLSTAVIRVVATSNGAISSRPGVDAGFFPSYGRQSTAGSLAGVSLQGSRSSSGQMVITATGVQPEKTYNLQSSSTLGPGSFGPPQTFTGAQLLSGIDINLPEGPRFFRLINLKEF